MNLRYNLFKNKKYFSPKCDRNNLQRAPIKELWAGSFHSLHFMVIVIHCHMVHIHELINSHADHELYIQIDINSWTLKIILYSCS